MYEAPSRPLENRALLHLHFDGCAGPMQSRKRASQDHPPELCPSVFPRTQWTDYGRSTEGRDDHEARACISIHAREPLGLRCGNPAAAVWPTLCKTGRLHRCRKPSGYCSNSGLSTTIAAAGHGSRPSAATASESIIRCPARYLPSGARWHAEGLLRSIHHCLAYIDTPAAARSLVQPNEGQLSPFDHRACSCHDWDRRRPAGPRNRFELAV